MENSLKIEIIRPGKETVKAEAFSVQFPGYDGYIGIMHNRLPLVSIMSKGRICLTSNTGHKSFYDTDGGFVEVHNNVVSFLCDSISSN